MVVDTRNSQSAGAWNIYQYTRLFTIGLGVGLVLRLNRQLWAQRAEPTTEHEEEESQSGEESTHPVDPRGFSSNYSTQHRVECTDSAAPGPTMSRSDLEGCIACPVCFELPTIPLELGCGHMLCFHCTDAITEQSAQRLSVAQTVPKCPNCRTRISRHVFDLAINYPVSNLVDRIMAGEGKTDEHAAAKAQAALLLSERRRNGYPTGSTDPSTTLSRGPLPTGSGVGPGFALVL